MAAWLALATDMPRVDAALLELVAARDPGRLATAFRHADGTIEPLCTIYEPAARAVLEARVGAGERSLSAMLAASRVAHCRPGRSGAAGQRELGAGLPRVARGQGAPLTPAYPEGPAKSTLSGAARLDLESVHDSTRLLRVAHKCMKKC
jgi:hypothetical protein